ncbi:MAG: aminotransferase class III-fold pyridoxal phosphate-dependent enzyme [Acidobacteria bacterium]|nr:aminotransferase class III-fold pyridoxal phosphate-dependent enzyme [Acidobacteriota bacterium]
MTVGGTFPTPADAESLAREHWGLVCRAEPLAGEVDRNFLLVSENGDRWVLKVSRENTDPTGLEYQIETMRFLENSPVAHLVQRPLPTADGRFLLPFGPGESGRCWVRALSFLGGSPLVDLRDRPPAFLIAIGQALARLDLSLHGFDHPAAHRDHPWNIERTDDLLRFASHIPDPARRELVERHVERFRDDAVPRLAELERGVIHNDANDHNLLVQRNAHGEPALAGIIDFGDSRFTVTVAELAISAAYLMLDREHPLTTAALVTSGYNSVRPLSTDEQALLFDLIKARLCASLLMSARGLHEEPENEYLQISAAPVWRLLERMAMIDPDEATRAFEEACAGSRTPVRSAEEILDVRRTHFGFNLSVSYSKPLKIVRGEGQYLFDDAGRRYLDLVNNVCHVGHCHPQVVAAAQRQMAELNTNTRYLHDNLAEYVLRLAGTFPNPLEVCFFTNSGTEANDLALRLARTRTGSKEIIVLDHAYHGHSPSLVEISPYKCEGPGGQGLAGHAHKVPMPDTYRGPHRGLDAGIRYAGEVGAAIADIADGGKKLGAFMAESLIGCGGQVIPAPGFLAAAAEAVRSAGGVVIADEVQVGFGRVGTHLWAFESQDVVPDIVTLGKPIGNGHPMAAVVTTREIAASFVTGMEYFNTFGGNPVSCAVGLAVLDVIETQGLQQHALEVGTHMLDGLRELQARHCLIGDVRGLGLFIGVELVRDHQSLEPADTEASRIIDEMKSRGFLLSTDGPLHNVLKIKPPMVLTAADADQTLEALDEILGAFD